MGRYTRNTPRRYTLDTRQWTSRRYTFIPFRSVFDCVKSCVKSHLFLSEVYLTSNPNQVYLWLGRHGAGRPWATDFCQDGRALPRPARWSSRRLTIRRASTTSTARRTSGAARTRTTPSSSRLARRSSGCCRGQCQLLQRALPPSWPGMWRRSRICEPLFLLPSLASQPRCAAAMHCVSYHVYASRTLTHSCHRRFT